MSQCPQCGTYDVQPLDGTDNCWCPDCQEVVETADALDVWECGRCGAPNTDSDDECNECTLPRDVSETFYG